MPSDLGDGLVFAVIFLVGVLALLLFLAWLETPSERRQSAPNSCGLAGGCFCSPPLGTYFTTGSTAVGPMGAVMSTSNPSTTQSSASEEVSTTSSNVPSKLQTSQGKTTIADSVVQKIAGVSAGEVSGVHALGGGAARTIGAIRERIPGSSQSAGQGVAVEVGERQAAIDLDIVIEYGVSIVELSRAVRRNVIESVEGMTGLEVTEVNVSVNDIHLPTDDQQEEREPRVE
jgi:uncharacterized alkaline shock family protein YloU